MIPPRSLLDTRAILARYDELRDTGSAVPYCEFVILVEFGLHPAELHRLLSEDARTKGAE